MNDSNELTHTAFAMKPAGKKQGRWLEIGSGRIDSSGVIHVFLDRTPIGGFNGYVYMAPNGMQPPGPEPHRPAGQRQDDEDLG